MKCLRCNGLVIREKYYHEGESWIGEKCLNCGEIVDEVIRENRRFNNARSMHLARLQFLRTQAEDYVFDTP